MAVPFKVKAVFEYKSPHADDLSFPLGQVISVTEQEDDDWYIGEYTDNAGTKQEGLFPKNFVEKYEPEAPPRPTRARPKKDAPAPALAAETAILPTPALTAITDPTAPIEDNAPAVAVSQPMDRSAAPQPAKPDAAVSEVAKPEPASPNIRSDMPKPSAASKAPPPAVAEKPSSFKDRIAAFNKSSAVPVAPIKPGAPAGASPGFIKKPFVAPPPARDAYVPPPREALVHKVYRRDEDPEIAEQEAQNLEDAERAGLVGGPETSKAEEAEEVAKPTSLKDRIAALQKQQQEQAQRRTDVSAKDKPKKAVKKRTDSTDIDSPMIEPEGPELTRIVSQESIGRRSGDTFHSDMSRPPVVRQLTRERDLRSPSSSLKEFMSDPNDADLSGAGDTEADIASVEEVEERLRGPAPPSRLSTVQSPIAHARNDAVEDAEGDEEDQEEEEELDAETRRKLELRERMAKMSGGMGMPGMFMPMPMGGKAMSGAMHQPKRRQTSGSSHAAETEAPASPPQQRMPMMVLPGMQPTHEPEQLGRPPVVRKEPEPEMAPISQRHAEQVPDVEDLQPAPSTYQQSSSTSQQQRLSQSQGTHDFLISLHGVSPDPLEALLLDISKTVPRRSYVVYNHQTEMVIIIRAFSRSEASHTCVPTELVFHQKY